MATTKASANTPAPAPGPGPAPELGIAPSPFAFRRGVKIVPKRDGFRRAGHAFPAEGKTIPLDELTPEQIEQLATEPMLVAMPVDFEPVEADEPAQAPE